MGVNLGEMRQGTGRSRGRGSCGQDVLYERKTFLKIAGFHTCKHSTTELHSFPCSMLTHTPDP